MKKKFKNIAKFLAAAVALTVVASCAKEDIGDVTQILPKGVERNIKANADLPSSAASSDKAYIDYQSGNSSHKVLWNLSDQINVNGDNLTEIMLHNDFASPRAEFGGLTHALTSGTDEIYWAVYPTTLAGTYTSGIPANFTPNTLTVDLPNVRTYNVNENPLQDNTYMAAYASVPQGETDIIFQMKNLTSVLRINLQASAATASTSTRATRIVFSSPTSMLSGDFEANTNIELTAGANAYDNITVYLTDGVNNYVDIANGAVIYVALPAMRSGNLVMRVYNDEGYYYTNSASNITLARSSLYTSNMSNIVFNEEPRFAIAVDHFATFAPGNLQYNPASGDWRFAAEQYDIIGTDNNNAAASYNGWIDLFGWGTSGHDNTLNDALAINFHPYDTSSQEISTTNNVFGYGPSSNMTDGSLVGTSELYDWGMKNRINNPKTNEVDAARTWRCLTAAEWNFVFNTRPAATVNGVANARFVKATVCGVSGIIIFPDDFINVGHQLRDINDATSQRYPRNTYTNDEWPAMEEAGCVFLPCAGYRSGNNTQSVGNSGQYWAASRYSSKTAKYVKFSDMTQLQNGFRCTGRAVRLAKDF